MRLSKCSMFTFRDVEAAGQPRVKYLCVTLSIYFEFLKQKLLVTYNINIWDKFLTVNNFRKRFSSLSSKIMT